MPRDVNHFYFSYIGSKRKELPQFANYLDMTNITDFIEPFGGSAAVSYHLHGTDPALTFHINDRDPFLLELWDRVLNRRQETAEHLNTLINDVHDKHSYESLMRQKTWFSEMVGYSYMSYRHGLYPLDKPKKPDFVTLLNKPYSDFLESPRVHLTGNDFRDICEEYKDNEHAFIFLDPPYVNEDNTSYVSDFAGRFDFEESYLYMQNLLRTARCKILMIVSNRLVPRLLFADFIRESYDKRYSVSRRETKHLIISNYQI